MQRAWKASVVEWLPSVGYGWVLMVWGGLCGTVGFLQELSRSGVIPSEIMLVQTAVPTWGWYVVSVLALAWGGAGLVIYVVIGLAREDSLA